MPELPEVETVRQGLIRVMEGQVFKSVTLNRPDLRFPFASDFVDRIENRRLVSLGRRAKFLNCELDSGDRLLMHLGMTGTFSINPKTNGKHDHVEFKMQTGDRIVFSDPRRFGFMELVAPDETSRLDHIGPEPLSNGFNAPELRAALKGRKSKIKSALLDQRIVAGLGNIYVCEALYRAGISPRRAAGRLKVAEAEILTGHIKDVLREAIASGGSTLRDFANAEGDLGYFQHSFDVYGREGEDCRNCGASIQRIVQSGRSSFFCGKCQR